MIAKRFTLINALQTAADQFDRFAASEGLGATGERRSIQEQFERQATEVRKLAEEIEQADTITLVDG